MPLNFEKIELKHRDLVEACRNAWQIESSEYNFSYLFIWGARGHIHVAFEEDVMYTLLTYQKEKPFMLAPLPLRRDMDYKKAMSKAEEYFESLGAKPRFVGVTGPIKEAFETHCKEYELREDRANFDYVYRMQDLLTLRGKKYHGKRNHINQFRANYQFEYIKVDETMRDECLEVYLKWLATKDVEERGVLGELEAVKALFAHMETLGIAGGGIRVDGRLVAFTLGERMRPDMALIHIEKVDPEYNIGLYTLINQQFVEHEWQDVEWINREEDMGLEGLRKSKLSYQPARMIEKFEAVKRP